MLMAVSAITFTSCDWLCKKCPECPENRPTSTTKVLNYYIGIIDTITPSAFEYYTVKLNNNTSEKIVPGKAFNVTYNPITEKDSLKVRVDAWKGGKTVFIANYILPIYWSDANGGDTLFQTQLFYNPNPTSISSIGPPVGGTQPVPICTKHCN